MVGLTDQRTEPFKSVLIDGTNPDYHPGNGASGQSILPGLLVYKSGTLPDNEVTVCGALYGSSMETESTIYTVEIPKSHPTFPKSYDKATAFTAQTDGFKMHRLVANDKLWVKGNTISGDEGDNFACAANGLVAQLTGDTADKWNCHGFKLIGEWGTAVWAQAEYVGFMSVDSS